MVGPDRPLWVITEAGPIRNPALTDEEFDQALEAARQANVSALWQAAHDFEFAEISGSAIGLLVVGVLQGLPKCVAVRSWINGIWDLYYQRKPQVTHEWAPELLDFSACGPCPYTVPDLLEELGMR